MTTRKPPAAKRKPAPKRKASARAKPAAPSQPALPAMPAPEPPPAAPAADTRSIVERRVAFGEQYVTDAKGRRFSVEGREWVRDELWSALDGYKLRPTDPDRCCPACRTRAGSLTLDAAPVACGEGCEGLTPEVVLVTVLCAERRGGKTFNSAAYVLSTLYLQRWRSIAYVAAAFGQTATLVFDNFERPIKQAPKLAALASIVGSSITVQRNKSSFEFVPTSHRSITGRGRTIVIIDEARDVTARTAMALLPSVLESRGVECPAGHLRVDAGREPADGRCPTCSTRMVPWHGRILIMSSAGLSEGSGEHDWFRELVERLEREPDPSYHLIRMDKGANPLKSEQAVTALERVFGGLASTSEHVAVEMTNAFVSRGDAFLTSADVAAVTDRRRCNLEGSPARCVAFLDTSDVGDLTSLVVLGDESQPGEAPWSMLGVLRIDAWDPQRLGGAIDERMIQAHLDAYVPLFPLLEKLAVDVRGRPWAARMVQQCRQARPGWGRKVESFTGRDTERDAAWSLLRQRIAMRTVRMPDHPTLRAELAGLRLKEKADGRVQVTDASRKRRHADIADSLAHCCYLVHQLQIVQRTTLVQVASRPMSARRSALDAAFRPLTAGLGEDSF